MLLSSSKQKRDTIACVSFRYYKSLLILSPCLMQMHKSKATLTLSPCLRGTSRRRRGLLPTPCSLFPTPYSLLLTPCTLLLIPSSLTNWTHCTANIATVVVVPVHVDRIEEHVVGVVRIVGVERTRPVVADRPSNAERAFVHVTRSGQED